jgi:superfamily II DNA or RNA helicase
VTILRDYQRQAIDAAWEAITPEANRVALEMATGLGKTITFAALIDEWLKDTTGESVEAVYEGLVRPRPRALVLVHTDELVSQAVEKILFMTGGHFNPETRERRNGRWTVGIVKAGLNEVDVDIVVASVQTLASLGRREQVRDVGLIIVDECHHAVAKTYQDILVHFKALGGAVTVPTFGFTATLGRSDGQGLGQVWQDLAFSRSLPWAIRKGWLVDLVPYTITIPGVSASSSDAALDAMLADSIAPEAVVQAWMDHAGVEQVTDLNGWYSGARPSTVLFAPLVRSAQAFADAFNEAGVRAEVVHGGLRDAERRAILDRYDQGITTVVCNAMVLTEGWDSPRTKCVIVARLTQSVPLFVQMLGRGMRFWLSAMAPPREDQRCILLCVAGTTTDIATVADLSDNIGEVTDGKSLLQMEDEFDLGADIEPDEDNAYRGPVRVEQWDALVQRSSKAWKYTAAGVPFLPITKRGAGFVFIVEAAGESQVWARGVDATKRAAPGLIARKGSAPDLELALSLAEDVALDLGGDIGVLLADKTRAWRKKVPTPAQVGEATRAGVPERELAAILGSKAAGKAGKLSDAIDRVVATRVLDHLVVKIRERGARQ